MTLKTKSCLLFIIWLNNINVYNLGNLNGAHKFFLEGHPYPIQNLVTLIKVALLHQGDPRLCPYILLWRGKTWKDSNYNFTEFRASRISKYKTQRKYIQLTNRSISFFKYISYQNFKKMVNTQKVFLDISFKKFWSAEL